MSQNIDLQKVYKLCVEKTRKNINMLADQPKSWSFSVDGNYSDWNEGFFEIGNWTTSFFTGMAALEFEVSGDLYFLKQLNRFKDLYKNKVNEYGMDTMHDLGFLYILYSKALYMLTGDPDHKNTAIKAAEELAKRYNVKGEYIRAWGRMDDHKSDYEGLAIIDCMMNIPLLFWASHETGNSLFYDIAVKHADTTYKLFVREDYSVYHAYRFDSDSGKPKGGDNYCGYSINSHWARGTNWAIYGFALAYGYTNDSKYLEISKKIADKYLECMGDNLIPIWDFRLSEGSKTILDSSAASVSVCGFMEILKYDKDNKKLANYSDKILNALCTDEYIDFNESCAGILKKAEVGDGIGAAKNAYTSWGDYYLMEALAKKLHGVQGYW